MPDARLLVGQTESYVEYDRTGRIVKGAPKVRWEGSRYFARPGRTIFAFHPLFPPVSFLVFDVLSEVSA